MATLAASLFVRFQPGDPVDDAHNRLLFNQFGGTPAIPALNADDTLALSVFYLGQGSGDVPYRGARYPGSTTTVRLRAAGNSHTYATADSSSEIVPSTGAVIGRVATGTTSSTGTTEKQRLVFNSVPLTGHFRLSFTKPASGGSSSLGFRMGLSGTTNPIPITASASDILTAILSIQGYYYYETGGGLRDGPFTFAEFVQRYGEFFHTPVVTGNATTGFTIEFGTLNNGYNTWAVGMALFTVDDSDIQYACGWNVSLPETAVDFTDLFLTANAPAYLEVLINGNYVAQYLLTTSGGVSGGPPGPLPGQGGPPGNVSGIIYDGDHFGSPWAISVMLTTDAFPEAPGYHIFHQRYRCARSKFASLGLDSPCPDDGSAGLVEESERQDVGGADLVEWERRWAHIPPTLVDYEIVDYVWQTSGQINGQVAIRTFPLTRLAKRTRTFYRTTNPASIPLLFLPRAFVFNGLGYTIGPYHDVFGGQTTIARDDKLERWMGNIWMKTHWDITI